MAQKLAVTYLHHSGFMVQCTDKLLIFDFYSDPGNPGQRDRNLACVKAAVQDPTVSQVFIFASHNHRDHFDPDILLFDQYGKPATYLLSSDIPVRQKKAAMHRFGPNEQAEVGQLVVYTYASTDEGVSFLVFADGIHIFHAGDLNWWYWFYESTAEELAEYEQDFKSIIRQIGRPRIDVAFFPVDPRLREYDGHGGEHFIEMLRPGCFFPMHFGYDYAATRRFQERISQKHPHATVMAIDSERQSFSLEV